MSLVILLGGSGYIGQAFAKALQERGIPFQAPTRAEVDYTRFDVLADYLRRSRPDFLVNAAGYTGKPNVDACEKNWADTLQGNALFPGLVAHACAGQGIPMGHVSSGCIYSGAKIAGPSGMRVERNLLAPEVADLLKDHPNALQGFNESDEPNFTFRQPPCSFYSGTKALGEEALRQTGRNYIWRLRIPFDQFDSPRNYLSKLQNYPRVYDNVNSLSHRADFVSACLELWIHRAPFGTYNVTNPGHVTSRQVVGMIQEILRPARKFEFWENDAEFYRHAAATPRSNCVLDSAKLLAAGIQLRPVEAALRDALNHWTPLPAQP